MKVKFNWPSDFQVLCFLYIYETPIMSTLTFGTLY